MSCYAILTQPKEMFLLELGLEIYERLFPKYTLNSKSKNINMPGMVVHAYITATQETDTGRSQI